MPQTEPIDDTAEQAARAALTSSRFLFVDVAAQRAKQLRRGALPRLEMTAGSHKLERVAMEEVRTGLIEYSLPPGLESAAARAEYQDRNNT
jgi:DNA-directed RNA polymerase omega subunit